MKFVLDKTLGYMYSYSPNHPLANKAGKVYEHIYVMCKLIGRPLREDECVHHIDRNRANNNINNLLLLTHSEHAYLHAVEDGKAIYIDKICPCCKNKFTTTKSSDKNYCSNQCKAKSRRKINISKEELKDMVWSEPTIKVAEKLGVSDVAIGKICKKLGIPKPPVGFWTKVKYGKINNTSI